MLISLPIVLVIRTAVFFSYGLYRGVWRYTTFDDIIRIAKAISVGSAIMVVSFTLLFRFKAFPRSVFIIDWFILAVFMCGSRIAARWFHELPSREELPGKRVIIAGTGALAELILQRVKKVGELRAIGYVDDRMEMTGRIIHGLKVLGPLSGIADMAEKYRADEVIVMSSFYDRIPAESRDRLERAGIRIQAVSDPSEISVSRMELGVKPPCEGQRVLVAGNGTLVDAADIVFSRSSRLVLVSNEGRLFERKSGFAGNRTGEVSRHLGILDDRPALERVFEAAGPERVFADFAPRGANLDNATEAYARTVLLPLEKIASEASRRAGTRLVVIGRGRGAATREWFRAAEVLVLDAFRRDPKRLTMLRMECEPSTEQWCTVCAQAVETSGGLFSVLAPVSEERTLTLVEIPPAGPAPDISGLFRSLTRGLDGGEADAVAEAIRALSSASPLPEHVS